MIIEFYKIFDEDRLKIMFGSIWPKGQPSLNQMKEYMFIELEKYVYSPGFLKVFDDADKKDFDEDFALTRRILNCFTRISFVAPIGFEYWYIKDFGKGPGISKYIIFIYYILYILGRIQCKNFKILKIFE